MAAIPGPAPLPAEHARTVPSPARPPLRQTWRLPTPPSALAAARRTPVPPPETSSPEPGAPQSLPAAQEALLRDELTKARAEIARRDRDARAAAEARSPAASFPPPAQRSQSPAPLSAPAPKPSDWEKLGFKVATAVVAALVIVIAALSYWAVAAINAKTEAIKSAQEAKMKADSRDAQWRQWASVVTWIQDCRNGQQLDVNEMLLPSPDKMGSSRKLEPWIVKCPKLLPPPP